MADETSPIDVDFAAGLAGARDEAGFLALEQGDVATTTLNSPWFYDLCQRCFHTFRLGDHVRKVDGIVHESGELDCGRTPAVNAPSQPPLGDFFAGMDEEWPAPADVRVTLLQPGDTLLAPPFGGFRRATCIGCGHTFRSLDLVVICPCSPFDPLCQAAIHRDSIHSLSCFDSWNPTGEKTHCPITSRKLE